ncbi:MAG: 30S ribosome-binding factor RbfA [Prevotellaceae bacterium]|jgi:ribosome-binding factor A|nr:30S ribosome-binding factor RbfA [Prevotellaceae bacterium]
MDNTNTRQLKISRQIQKDLGEIFQLRGMATYQGALITVSEVRMTPDLSIARVFISVFPSTKSEPVLLQITQETKAIRAKLAEKVRHQLRIVPELQFYIDETLDKLEHIDELLKQ